MTRQEIQNLRVTDQVGRRGNVLGLVLESTPTHVKIAWDGQGLVPTTYTKQTEALNDVWVTRKADAISFTPGAAHRFRVHRRNA
jgi:hypothetical protein